MSFLIDPALLYAGGRTYAATTPEQERTLANDLKVGVQTMAFFYAVSVGLYLDHEWTKPIWRPVRAKSGRDWMINSGVTRFDAAKAGPRTHKLAATIFATYPIWLWLGMRGGRRGQLRNP
jgi:hypothetical protein